MTKKIDPYSINYSFNNNSITFRGDELYIPFDFYKIFVKITALKGILFDENVCAVDLEAYPLEIFSETELKGHPLAARIYNILYTWLNEQIKPWHKGKKDYLLNDFLKACLTVIEALPPEECKEAKAPVIALFCSLMNESQLIVKGETESIEKYCTRICNHFNFTYKVRVSKGFYGSWNDSNLQKVKELILPQIGELSREKILEFLDKKQQQKQKLYG